MKITATRKDDLIRERDEYDAETARYEKIKDEQLAQFRQATDAAAKGIEDAIRDALGDTFQDIDIRVDPYGRSSLDNNTWAVRVQVNEHNKFADDVALTWSWEAAIDKEGNVVKDSGSWSGLKAVTPEQINDLEESVRLIKILNNLDWSQLLRRARPRYEDYIDTYNASLASARQRQRRDFASEIAVAELEEHVGTDEWIKMEGRPDTDYYRGSSKGDYWVKIDKMSPKFATVHIAPDVRLANNVNETGTNERISINKLLPHIVKPIQTM